MLVQQTDDCILIVDDDHQTRVLLREILEEQGYYVMSAADGETALSMLKAGRCKPCLIILDLMMPLMSGLEFLKEVQANSKLQSIPLLVISSAKDMGNVTGVQGFLPKPIHLEELLKRVKELRKPFESQ